MLGQFRSRAPSTDSPTDSSGPSAGGDAPRHGVHLGDHDNVVDVFQHANPVFRPFWQDSINILWRRGQNTLRFTDRLPASRIPRGARVGPTSGPPA